MIHVRQIRPFRTKLGNHVKRLIESEMCRMRFGSQRIEDQYPQSLQARPTVARNLTDVGAIRHVADAEAEHVEVAVIHRNRRDDFAEDRERIARDALKGQLGNHGGGQLLCLWAESVGERRANLAFDIGGAVERHRPPSGRDIGRRSSRPEQMIRVIVGEQYGVDETDALAQELQSQLRGRVDEDAATRQAQQHGAAIALVVRIGREADGTFAAEHGHADRRAGAEKSEATRGGVHRISLRKRLSFHLYCREGGIDYCGNSLSR